MLGGIKCCDMLTEHHSMATALHVELDAMN